MLDIQLLRSDLDGVAKRLATRGVSAPTDEFLRLEAARKQVQTRTQELQNRRNIVSKQVGEAKRKGEDASALMAEAAALPGELKALEQELDRLQQQLTDLLLVVPNLPHASVPVGTSADDNVEVRRVGEPRRFDFPVKDHVDLGEGLGLLDFERATKISGARFSLMTGAVARLHRALAQFMLDVHTREHGYTEVYAPYLVNAASLRGTGKLPKFEDDLFAVPRKDAEKLYLIPTAEVPVTNIVRDEIVAARAAAAQVRLPYAVLPQRSRLLRQGHARHDPPAPVRQSRAGPDRPSRPILRGPGAAHCARRRDPQALGAALPGGDAVHRRHGFLVRQDL